MDIVEELRQNRESGARRLVSEYKAGLMSIARRFFENESDAEELVNATFAKVVANIDDYLERTAFFAWMCQILTNEFRNSVRRKSSKMEVYPGVLPEMEDESAQEAIYDNLDHSLLRNAISRLPDEDREILILHYFLDVPVSKMAKVLTLPCGTVKSRLRHARKALAAKLGVKVHEAVKKPGVKATLLVLALCALTAAGAAVTARWGELSERAAIEGQEGLERQEGQEPQSSLSSLPLPSPSCPPRPSCPSPTPLSNSPTLSLSNSQGDLTMNTTTRTAALGAATALALAAAPPAASADDYQYIILGDPVAAATEGMTASRSTPPGPLEMREHAVARSRATALTSTKPSAFTIIVR